MPKQPFLFLVLLAPYMACAQVSSGTVIILNFTKDKLIVAADSRGRYGKGNRPPDDSQCKIVAFGHKTVFATMGTATYHKSTTTFDPVVSWTNWEIAQSAFRASQTKGAQAHVAEVASTWASMLSDHWRTLNTWHPDVVRERAEAGNGILTAGFFAEASGRTIYTQTIAIRFINGIFPIDASVGEFDSCWTCGQKSGERICALGTVTVPAQLCSQSSPIFLPARKSGQATKLDDAEDFTIWLGNISAACDLTGGIGGDIDALDLGNDGSIRWLAKKNNCPENQE